MTIEIKRCGVGNYISLAPKKHKQNVKKKYFFFIYIEALGINN